MDAKELLERYASGERDFQRAILRGENLRKQNLWGIDLFGADLMGADFWNANLAGADLRNANLKSVDFDGTNLRGAKGITAISNIGLRQRTIYCYKYAGFIRFQLGCFNGTYDEAITAIKGKYDNIELRKYLTSYLASIEALKLTLEAQYDE